MEITENTTRGASTYDELLMQHSMNFADSLKELKDLQAQLYSAAEYFELSYTKDDHKQLVIETFKEYATKALVSTVDHLGSVASKLNDFLEEKVDEVSATKFRFSCIEQRLHSSQEFIDLSGRSQQSLVLGFPKHHKRYMISAGKFVNTDGFSESANKSSIASPRDNLRRTKQAFLPTRSQSLPLPSWHRRGHSRVSSSESSESSSTFSFTTSSSDKEQRKRSVSPFSFALKRTGSVANRSASPSISSGNPWAPSEPRRAIILGGVPQRDNENEMEMYSKRSKHLLKALLSIHRSRKEGIPSRFRDER